MTRIATQNSTKKERAIPFTVEEDLVLTETYKEYKDVIDAKLSAQVGAADKSKVWAAITEKINSKSNVKRSLTEVKTRWKNLKRIT